MPLSPASWCFFRVDKGREDEEEEEEEEEREVARKRPGGGAGRFFTI